MPTVTVPVSFAKSTGNVRPLASQVRPTSSSGADAFTSLQEQVDSARKTASVTLTVPPNSITGDIVLVAGTMAITSPAVSLPSAAGDRLTVFLQAAGPTALFTWDAAMFKFAGTEFDSTSGTWTVFSFIARIDDTLGLIWFCTGIPLTGQS